MQTCRGVAKWRGEDSTAGFGRGGALGREMTRERRVAGLAVRAARSSRVRLTPCRGSWRRSADDGHRVAAAAERDDEPNPRLEHEAGVGCPASASRERLPVPDSRPWPSRHARYRVFAATRRSIRSRLLLAPSRVWEDVYAEVPAGLLGGEVRGERRAGQAGSGGARWRWVAGLRCLAVRDRDGRRAPGSSCRLSWPSSSALRARRDNCCRALRLSLPGEGRGGWSPRRRWRGPGRSSLRSA